MESLEQFLSLVARHGTFLLLVLPIVGALLVVLSAPWGRDIVLRTALTNAALAIAISLLMLVHFDPTPPAKEQAAETGPQFQMASSSRLEVADVSPNARPLLRIDVGVDGISLWFVALLPLVSLAAVIHARDERNLTTLLALLLLLQALLTGLFAAINVLQFVVCLEAATLVLFLLVGRWGGPDLRREIAPTVVFQLAGSLLVTAGLLTLVIGHSWLYRQAVGEGDGPEAFTFSLATLVSDVSLLFRSTDAAGAWGPAESLMFWLLLPGFAIKAAVFPFHRGFCSAGTAWPACAGVYGWGVFPCIGVYGVLRVVAPVCEHTLAAHASTLIVLLLLGSVYCGMLALAQSELKRTVAYASVAHAGLAFAAAMSQTAAGTSAAVFHLIGHVAGFSLLVAVVAAIERRYETLEIRAFGGLARRLPWVSAAFFVAACAICGLPGLSGFPAVWQTVVGLVGMQTEQPSLARGALSLLVAGLLAWALLSTGQRIFWGNLREPLPDFRFNELRVESEELRVKSQRPEVGGRTKAEGGRRKAEGGPTLASLNSQLSTPHHSPTLNSQLSTLSSQLPHDWKPPERIASVLFAAVLLAVGVAPQFVADRVLSNSESGRPKAESSTSSFRLPPSAFEGTAPGRTARGEELRVEREELRVTSLKESSSSRNSDSELSTLNSQLSTFLVEGPPS